ncbi:hypothetical protein LJC32_00005 [Oscillospiraceae bacterium OttesenSCG-928-F05]|nr:hypothetical protein [Oscillospiraceae bacterium OttesenSCG-928-F05]
MHQNDRSFPYERRRRKPDKLTRAIQIAGWIAWGTAILFALFWMTARPDTPNFFTRVLNINVVGGWNAFYLRIAFFLMVATFLVCLTGLLINMRRHKRKTDRFNKSLIILGILSLISAVVLPFVTPFSIF